MNGTFKDCAYSDSSEAAISVHLGTGIVQRAGLWVATMNLVEDMALETAVVSAASETWRV